MQKFSKTFWLATFFVSSIHSSYTPKMIALPAAPEIRRDMCLLGVCDFAKKSTLADELANKQLYPDQVLVKLNAAIGSYNQELNKNNGPYIANAKSGEVHAKKIQILTSLLKNNPKEAHDFLKSHGLI